MFQDRETIKGFFLIIAAMAIFGFYGIFIRFLGLAPQLILFFNALFVASIFLILFLRNREKFDIKKHRLLIFLLGIAFIGNNFFYFTALKITTIANAILTHYTAPIFVAILVPFLLRERLERNTITALIFSFFGLTLLASEGLSLGETHFLGIIFGAASGLMYALSIIIYKHLLKSLSVFTLIFYQSLIGAIILIPFIAPQLSISLPFFWLLAFALLFGIFATFLHFQGIKRIKAQYAGILGYTEPIFGMTYAFFFFTEIPTIVTLIGGVLIILGGYLIFKSQSS